MTAREELPTQSLELAREELSAWHHEERGGCCVDPWPCDNAPAIYAVADALLASPALARVIRKAKAEAWVEGRRDTRYVFNPYRDLTEETP